MDGNHLSSAGSGRAALGNQREAATNVQTTGSPFVAGGGGPALPAVSVPSGGGTLRTMEEAFDLNLVTGSASLRYGIPVTKIARWGTPTLHLTYSSGGGLTSYGIGWTLSGLGTISRSTRLGIPTYTGEQDVFEYNGDELVPVLLKADEQVKDNKANSRGMVETVNDDYFVHRYRRRVDNHYDRIERWTKQRDHTNVHWRVFPGDGTTLLFGTSPSSRTASGEKTFAWHYDQGYDSYGSAQLVEYQFEDGANVDISAANERNRSSDTRHSMVYPKRVFYGNKTPNRTDDWGVILPGDPEIDRSSWMFELVFDYGEHDMNDPQPNPGTGSGWPVRQDPTSTYQPGFEVRNYRLCRRFLMFHHFVEELGKPDYLVSAFELEFAEDKNLSYLTSLGFVGYKAQPGGNYISKRLPRTEFTYSKSADAEQLREMVPESFDKSSLASLPSGISDQLEWMDLYGDGTTGILARNSDCWYYKRNLSSATPTANGSFDITVKFGEAEAISSRPLQGFTKDAAKASFQDLDGDGSTDLIVEDGNGMHGYFRHSKQVTSKPATWQSFHSFPHWPNLNKRDPNARLIDLSGTGRADLLITTDDVFIWHQSLGSDGYGPGNRVSCAFDDQLGPKILFSDVTQCVHLADMSGDGLVDIVRVQNRQVCYWPNLGHGQFGSKVTMDHAPMFDRDDCFNPRRLLLGDVDGSGTTDLLYFGSSGATLYNNQAGNSWSDPLELPGLVPTFDSITQICAINLLGSGMCLIWQSTGAATWGPVLDSIKYVDLTAGVKPHLLTSFVNNMGLETTLTYQTSTSYYLQDELEGKPWLTTIPIPIHCVDKVVKFDYISKARLSQRFRYHHGYYDGTERSFCGFGMVEQWDTEEFDCLSHGNLGANASNIDPATFTPPVHTKTWFHVGAMKHTNALRNSYEKEFYNGIELDIRTTPHVLVHDISDTFESLVTGHAYTLEELRQATYALRGATMREERYCDKTPPYMVSQYENTVSLLQPKGENAFISCRLYQSQSIQSTFDKSTTDGRTSQQFTLLIDAYGNTLKSVTVNYGRDAIQQADLEAQDLQEQGQQRILYNEAIFTHEIDTIDVYRIPIQFSSQSFELVGLKTSKGKVYGIEDFAGDGDFTPIKQLKDLEYFQDGVNFAPFGGVQLQNSTEGKRLLSSARRLFCSDDQTTRLAEGLMDTLAIVDQEYTLCMNPGMLLAYMQDGNSILPSDTVFSELGYIDLYDNKSWWLPSNKLFYGLEHENELAAARSSFFQSRRSIDPLGNTNTVEYDQYQLLAISATDPYGNKSLRTIDYRTLSAASSTDINGNQTDYAYDAINTLVAIAIVAKGGTGMDSLEEFDPDLTQEDLDTFSTSPLDQAEKVLGTATQYFIYDVNRYIDHGLPVYTSSIQRETFGASASNIQLVISYSDGSGRTIQAKSKAEDNKWRVSGRQVLNNKGLPVELYDPTFSSDHTYEIDVTSANRQIIFYDARSREVARLFPDHTWTKIEYHNWYTRTYGQNNLVDKNPAEDLDIGMSVRSLDSHAYLPSWQDRCKEGSSQEKRALEKSLKHKDNSSRAYIDPKGQVILQISETVSGLMKERSYFNIQGRSVVDKDAQQRIGQQRIYDMLGRIVVSATIDKGWNWTLADAMGNEAYSWTSSARFRQEYDKLNRLSRSYYSPFGSTEICLSKFEYGEDLDLDFARASNLRGKLSKLHDQSGTRTNQEYDVLGNCVRSDQQLAAEYKLDVDWSKDVLLEPDKYTTTSTFDALGRVVSKQAPDKMQTRYEYNAAGLLYQIAGKLDEDQDWEMYTSGIVYDELDRVISQTTNNGTMCTWTYDAASRKLIAKSIKSKTAQLQDIQYVYDASGNLVFEIDKQQTTVYFRNARVSAGLEYTYDNLNRLVEASGREHLGQTQGNPFSSTIGTSAPVTGQTAAGADGSALARYTESYKLDSCGNILQIRHKIDDVQSQGWTRRLSYEEPSKIEPHVTSNALSSSNVGNSTERFAYDENGNTISMASISKVTWNPYNQLRSTVSQIMKIGIPETTYYVYDLAGSRVRKIVERASSQPDTSVISSQTYYLDQSDHVLKYHGAGDVSLECWTSKLAAADKVYVLVERWSGSLQSSKNLPSILKRYQCHDQSNSVFLELDYNANVISYEEYSPYGSTSYRANIYSAPKRYRFAGKERDHETGFYYNEQRYYLPWLCRWLNPDPADTVDGLNLYAFVQGNPVMHTDSSGLSTDDEGDDGEGDKQNEYFEVFPDSLFTLYTTELDWINPVALENHPVESTTLQSGQDTTHDDEAGKEEDDEEWEDVPLGPPAPPIESLFSMAASTFAINSRPTLRYRDDLVGSIMVDNPDQPGTSIRVEGPEMPDGMYEHAIGLLYKEHEEIKEELEYFECIEWDENDIARVTLLTDRLHEIKRILPGGRPLETIPSEQERPRKRPKTD